MAHASSGIGLIDCRAARITSPSHYFILHAMQLAVSAMRVSRIAALSRHAAALTAAIPAAVHSPSWMAIPRAAIAAPSTAIAVGVRALHFSARVSAAVLDEQTLKQAAQWNLAARLGTIGTRLALAELSPHSCAAASLPQAGARCSDARALASAPDAPPSLFARVCPSAHFRCVQTTSLSWSAG